MPLADFRRAVRLGLRRGESVRAVPAVRHARRSARVRRRRARARARRDPRRRLQPLRSRRQLSPRVRAARTSASSPTEWGDAINFDGPDSAPVREYLRHERALLDRGVPLRRTAARRHAADLRRVAAAHHRRHPRRRAPRVGRARTPIVVAENEPQDTRLVRAARRGRLRARRAVERRLPSRACVAATGRDEAYYSGYRGVAQEFVSAAKYGFLYQGQWFRVAGPSARHAGARSARRRSSSRSSRITIRWRTPPRAGGCIRRPVPAAIARSRRCCCCCRRRRCCFRGRSSARARRFSISPITPRTLAAAVREGRTTFISQFPEHRRAQTARRARRIRPIRGRSCCSKLDWSERAREHADRVALASRSACAAPRRSGDSPRRSHARLDGAVLDDHAFVLRFFGDARRRPTARREPRRAAPRRSDRRAVARSAATARCVRGERSSRPRRRVYGGWGTPRLETSRRRLVDSRRIRRSSVLRPMIRRLIDRVVRPLAAARGSGARARDAARRRMARHERHSAAMRRRRRPA